MAKTKKKTQPGTIATNRRARHDFDIEQTFEAGVALVGSEVKTLRGGKATLTDAYGVVRGTEVFLYGVHIPEYAQASIQNHEPTRARKLLLKKDEIARIAVKTEQQGYTLIPLRLYFKANLVKVELALARGRKTHDKRHAIAKREADREMARAAASARRSR